jgi:hypothetical protein
MDVRGGESSIWRGDVARIVAGRDDSDAGGGWKEKEACRLHSKAVVYAAVGNVIDSLSGRDPKLEKLFPIRCTAVLVSLDGQMGLVEHHLDACGAS